MKVGYVALVGRPNVGKSTLLNRLLQQKLSIVSFRPQTTRHRILGIKTVPEGQMIFLDTPGIHMGERRAMNRYLNRAADSALNHADVIVWVVDRPEWLAGDEAVRRRLLLAEAPVVLVINKTDRLADKTSLLPFLRDAGKTFGFHEVIPLSASKGSNVEALEQSVLSLLPVGEPIYPEDQLSDRPQRFFVAEVIREKLLLRLGQEVPYAVTVTIESFREYQHLITIHATIWVEKEGQKAIVIGRQGSILKAVGMSARRELQTMLENRINLQLWVKVREGWSDNEAALRTLGYVE